MHKEFQNEFNIWKYSSNDHEFSWLQILNEFQIRVIGKWGCNGAAMKANFSSIGEA